jgi:hypothetical protein
MGRVTVIQHYSNFWYLKSHCMVFDRMLTGLQEHYLEKKPKNAVQTRCSTEGSMLEYIINTYKMEN